MISHSASPRARSYEKRVITYIYKTTRTYPKQLKYTIVQQQANWHRKSQLPTYRIRHGKNVQYKSALSVAREDSIQKIYFRDRIQDTDIQNTEYGIRNT